MLASRNGILRFQFSIFNLNAHAYIGCTWLGGEGVAFSNPRSPCPMYDWKGPEAGSGTYFALVHQTFNFQDPLRNGGFLSWILV